MSKFRSSSLLFFSLSYVIVFQLVKCIIKRGRACSAIAAAWRLSNSGVYREKKKSGFGNTPSAEK
jgi:hypothetical protein